MGTTYVFTESLTKNEGLIEINPENLNQLHMRKSSLFVVLQ
jgi:hypothetical protein